MDVIPAGAGGGRVYEVNLDVDAAIAGEYRAWLDAHVRAMLALPGFVSARVFEVLDDADRDGGLHLCVHYVLPTPPRWTPTCRSTRRACAPTAWRASATASAPRAGCCAPSAPEPPRPEPTRTPRTVIPAQAGIHFA
ncbi:MAG: DUF4286 family protein, partial [Luteimonas sp.]|nr:DUF4286 family protein [Luteimonas sp.]